MKRLGVVENIAYDGTVLVHAEMAAAVGMEIVDKRRRSLGRVVKVFGSVREPFVSVRPKGPAPASWIGAEVFVGEGTHADQEDRRGRRSH